MTGEVWFRHYRCQPVTAEAAGACPVSAEICCNRSFDSNWPEPEAADPMVDAARAVA